MNRWHGKVAVVTGASSGIGLATAKALLKEGLIVIGFARRKEKMEDEMENVENSKNFHARACDVSDEKSIAENFVWIKESFGELSVLINNAGVMIRQSRIEDASVTALNYLFKVNLLGVLYCTKAAIPLMKKTNSEAQIINVNSILGHKIASKEGYNAYPASKFAVRALSETLTVELQRTKIRVSSVSPGLVKSEMSRSVLEKCPTTPVLEADDLANAMLYILAAPPHVEIVDIILQPKTQPQ